MTNSGMPSFLVGTQDIDHMRYHHVSFMSQSCLHFLFIQSLYSFSNLLKFFIYYTIILTIFDTLTQSSFLYFSQCNGKHISWRHLQQLYEQDRGKATGLSLVPKLKYEHVYLTPFSKMRVDLAAQVCLGIRTYVCI